MRMTPPTRRGPFLINTVGRLRAGCVDGRGTGGSERARAPHRARIAARVLTARPSRRPAARGARRRHAPGAAGVAGGSGRAPVDRDGERRQPSAGARRRPRTRDRAPPQSRCQPWSPDPPTADRERPAGAARCRRRSCPGSRGAGRPANDGGRHRPAHRRCPYRHACAAVHGRGRIAHGAALRPGAGRAQRAREPEPVATRWRPRCDDRPGPAPPARGACRHRDCSLADSSWSAPACSCAASSHCSASTSASPHPPGRSCRCGSRPIAHC